jgi:antitoxin (DNA-binding transcriptional repressor) of toxin-antitoxin stability system
VRRWAIDEARKALYDLVDAAARGRSTLIGRGAKTAVLAPLDPLGPDLKAQLSDLPCTSVTTARKKLGDLLAAAAAGTPQILLHRRAPAAILLPPSARIPVPAAPAAAKRRLSALGDVLGDTLAPTTPGPSFGLKALDAATAVLTPGTLTVVAAAPGAGGSLLAAAAARTTALAQQLPVLYAASGLTRTDVAMRVIAAEAEVDYRRLRTGTLTEPARQTASEVRARLAGAPLHIDDGTGLTAQAIAETAPYVDGLALVVVDRLQHTADPCVPLSGNALPAAARTLAHLARTLHLPVLAALDTDAPEVLAALNPDVTLALTRDGEYAQVIVAERDFGPVATVQLRAELSYARFTDAPTSQPSGPAPAATPPDPTQPTEPLGDAPGPSTPPADTIAHCSTATAQPTPPALDAAQAELLQAALPYLSGASTGLSARVTSTLAALRDAATAGTTALPGLRAATIDLAARGLRLPDTTEGHRLAAALQAFATAAQAAATPAQATRQAADAQRPAASWHTIPEPDPPAAPTAPVRPSRRSTAERPDLASFIPDRVAAALQMHDGDPDAALVYLAGAPNKAGQAIEDVMELWDATRVGGRYGHTAYPDLPDPLIRKRKGNADEVWEARPKYTNPAKQLRGQAVTPLDVNGAYLSALGAAALPVRSLTHNPNGTDAKGRQWSWENPGDYGRGANLAGIVRIDQPAWPHAHLPHPLGDDRETAGRLWIPTSVYAKLKDAKNAGLLEELPRIREAYVAPGTDNLFTILVNILRDARAKAIADGDALTKTYVAKMYAVLVSTIGDSGANHHLKRPDWEHIIRGHAFANLWRKAVRAHRAGLSVAYAGGTDELHLIGTDSDVFGARLDGKPVFRQGTGLAEIKVKGEPYQWSGKAVRN